MKKDGHVVAKCTVTRLMKELNLYGLRRHKVKRTTIADKRSINAADLVKRVFCADEPDKLWVADFTYISTREGRCYTAFVTDVFARRILGWNCSTLMSKRLVLETFKMAVFLRAKEGNNSFNGLIHHNDKGSQYTSDDFINLLALHGIQASVGTVGDPYDNALAETIIGTYKTELIGNKGPWQNIGDLRLETARWVNWYNTKRISKYNDWKTPVEAEQKWYNDGIEDLMGTTNINECVTVH